MSKNHACPAAKILLCAVLALPAACLSQTSNSPYPHMAPVAQYQMDRDAEIAMVRTAAPDSISRDAELLVLGKAGYETVAQGKNGFVCLVQRSWAAGVDNPEFWNPKVRAPICFNSVAAHSLLPHIAKKAEWVLAGLSKEQVSERIKSALESKEFPPIEPGAMCYMMSKEGYLSDADGHWRSHLMFFTDATSPESWGANLEGSPLLAATNDKENYSVFLLPVSKWSDGTPAPVDK